MEIYLDNSATTAVHPDVVKLMSKIMLEDYGNPSSKHNKGVQAERYLNEAGETLASILKCDKKELLYTSGGTESDNMAFIGTALANKRRGNHIITTMIEHPAILETTVFLEKNGFEITYLPVDATGRVSLEALKEALKPETILVSIMYANNEVSIVEPIAEAAAMVKEYNPEIIFHTDAVQAFGKYRIIPKRENIDLMSVSAHKLHGPKGVGFLYIKDKTKINPIIFGGGQQKGMRSGTENVPGIAGMALAAKLCYENFDEKIERLYELKEYFTDRVLEIPGTVFNGRRGHEGTPHVISISFENVRSEVLLHALEDKGIYVSSGSACSSNKPALSGTLKAIGVKNNLLDSTIRFSLCTENTKEELDEVIIALNELVPMLRRYTRH
ncbi:cysteine desulfurase [Firmicutes bacterium CAG:882]|jgi:cysteine desulfurase|nr:cysteine desulfurase [Firmicutes bacterium CAG:882]